MMVFGGWWQALTGADGKKLPTFQRPIRINPSPHAGLVFWIEPNMQNSCALWQRHGLAGFAIKGKFMNGDHDFQPNMSLRICSIFTSFLEFELRMVWASGDFANCMNFATVCISNFSRESF